MKFYWLVTFSVLVSSEKVPNENTFSNFEYVISETASFFIIHTIKKFATF